MDIDSSKTRPTMDDSVGVKHLKEVLRNIARLHSESMQPQAQAEGWGMSQSDDPRYVDPNQVKKVEKVKSKREECSYELSELGATAEDSVCSDLVGDEQQGSVLRSCGSRISGLCNRLQGVESSSTRAPLAYDNDPSHGIRLVDRPQESASVQRARTDRAAATDISKHAKFPPLDALDDAISSSSAYEDLRKHFQQRNRHHSRLLYLTDHALLNKGDFIKAIWDTAGEGNKHSSGIPHSASATSLGRGSTQKGLAAAKLAPPPGRKARFRRDLSVPIL